MHETRDAGNGAQCAIRACLPGDAAALAELYRRSVGHFGPRAYSPAQVAAWAGGISAEKIAACCGDGRHVAVAVAPDDTLLGWGDLEQDGHVDFLYCAPEAEGRRVGSALYDTLETHARAAGMARLYVEASELARHLFERRGFLLLRRNELIVNGVAIHNFSMEKWLTATRGECAG
ncbi:GNAT family N-acetyltransferase [Massilia dura]|uniref:GNAT family N-acetyltransferase n=2 Tax=Pseudoduganella dura TaxID=321982 RepID=A0A6I3XKE9_9BURK|nr:GNAT family N-acetyltransferase [Pseudoduganella dura]